MIVLHRETKETIVDIELELYGKGESDIQTGIPFFDHMLSALTKHSRIDLKLYCKGDIEVDFHHSVEDCGIVLGEALYKAIFPVSCMQRFGSGVAILDEAAVECNIDLSNRPYLYYDLEIDGKIGEFDCELIEEFFKSVAFNARISMHIHQKRGKNRHHIAESAFKAFALALKEATKYDKSASTPSTKGVL